ncbi:MAG: hypothetical protein DRQ39_10915 [Gammaproteobacteria bacterium]|nr:MAG: hypothetical protein DRQ39_10915 [Gammaproteobacteria bacterium]
MRTSAIILILFLSVAATQAQSLLGTNGWLNIPTAEMQEDGTFYFGGSFIDKNILEDYGSGEYNVFTYYFDLTFLPFLEIGFGNTRLLDYPYDRYTVDRRFSFRFRPLRERKYVPAIVIGAHDIYTSIANSAESNQYFSSVYIVATKHIPVKKSEFGFTLGYGFNVFRVNQFVGLFGGVSFSPGFYRPLKFIAEYDGKTINLGASVLLFKHLFVYAMLSDFKYFSGGLAYRVYLLNNFKKKRKDRKKK